MYFSQIFKPFVFKLQETVYTIHQSAWLSGIGVKKSGLYFCHAFLIVFFMYSFKFFLSSYIPLILLGLVRNVRQLTISSGIIASLPT